MQQHRQETYAGRILYKNKCSEIENSLMRHYSEEAYELSTERKENVSTIQIRKGIAQQKMAQ